MEDLDNWNDGAIDGYRGATKASSHPEYLKGYRHGQDQRRVVVVVPHRPEGYYHQKPE
jgi:hypothetical protein